jgi:ADP-ribosyl-[dinitrogen reductase] hydrolase
MIRRDRQRGMLLGLAIGDALGAAVEFEVPGSFEPVIGYRGGGPHGLEPGEWTDDTSMALALADSIAEEGWDLNDQAQRYLAWWQTGAYSVNGRVFDIGTTTVAALQRFQQSGNAWTSGDPSELASGNGSLMRLAPVPLAYARLFPSHLGDLVTRAVESSRPTHASPQCLSACACLAVALAALVNGVSREVVLDRDWSAWRELAEQHPLHPEVAEVMQGSFRRSTPPQILGSGYVVKSLEAALWAFAGAESFPQAVLRAVNLGNDADTTGAVCGQLAGACWGESGIPEDLLSGLAGRELLELALQKLLG